MGKIYEALELARRVESKPQDKGNSPLFLERGLSLGRELVVVHQPDSVLAESFRFLRAKITKPASGRPPRTILVTSSLMDEGKSFVAANLAVTISQSVDEFVLLIDADLRKPSIAAIFGVPDQIDGLSTYLEGNTPLPSLLRKTSLDKLVILPAGQSSDAPAEMLSSEKMKALIGEVRDRYPDRHVVIDSPPVELAPETSVVANEVDGILFVARYGQTPRHVLKSALAKLQRDKILGVIFNDCSETLKIYKGYGDYSKYGYRRKVS
jgi:protein-tyrosine kinase